MIHIKDNILLANVPKDATCIEVVRDPVIYGDPDWLMYVSESEDRCHHIRLSGPPGSYRFLALSTEMTEELAAKIVEQFKWGDYKDYVDPNDGFETALESFHSLEASIGCEAATYAVLNKIK